MNLLKKISVSLVFLVSLPAFADSFCTGKVTKLGVGRHGVVYVSGPGGLPVVYLCNLQGKSNGIETESCKAMYSSLLAAKAQNKPVSITFNPNIGSCSGLSSWRYAPNVNWVISE
ncbi:MULTISPECIES: hypothetical protein [Pseudoalteromonas]|uniref:Uncharacterized protein n=1 Tax=Pseudoalteromonas rubra TaxID=43658 RepID=A0A5S3UV63_9GAMM|nr:MULTISPECIES: hypothetical protein [Pseudoalteromonas]MCG7563005.1 hypothetical protein [Pseudoalteromonas sp. McH1-42]MEC4087818.1 hypothetical protein [Pseudoalteromonas rubra]QPB84285.1 hypothetical protein CWC22_015360 [Pseudoalteromonas rubra]